MVSPLTRQQPVVVVGAGLAGMTAALDLVDAGREVVVLEARDRVGGRVFTHHFDDTMHAELGGESIDDNHAAILAMVAQFGLGTEKRLVERSDDSIVYYQGTRMPIAAFLAREGGTVGTDYFRFLDALNAASAGLDPEHPERFERAAGLDATSLDEFIIGLGLVPEAEFLVRLEYRGEYNAEPADLSMLFIAQQNEGEDPGPLGVETMRITGGNSTLTAAMAAALGDRIQLARDDSARIAAFGAMLDEVFPRAYRCAPNATPPWRGPTRCSPAAATPSSDPARWCPSGRCSVREGVASASRESTPRY